MRKRSVKSRPYVDDITSDYSGPDPDLSVGVVSDMVRFTYQFAEDLQKQTFFDGPWYSCRFEGVAWPARRAVLSRFGRRPKPVQQGVRSQRQEG